MQKIVLKTSLFILMFGGLIQTVSANSTLDYVAVGGLKPIIRDGLLIKKTDVYLSKKQVRSHYQLKNSTNKTINETLVMTLPKIESYSEHRADTGGFIGSIHLTVNGKTLKPTTIVHTYLHPLKANGKIDSLKYLDVTAEFKSCGFTQSEMMNPWTQAYNSEKLAKRLLECKNETVQQLIQPYLKNDTEILWYADVNYHWKQSFKANDTADIKHSYVPILGKGRATSEESLVVYCADANFRKLMEKSTAKTGSQLPPYTELMYWNGVSAKQSIPEFKLTVERDADEIVTFCWDGETKKIADNRFEMQKNHFMLTQPLGLLLIKMKK